MEYNYLNFSGI